MKSLQEIKDEVSQEWGHTDWNDFGESFKHRLGSAHAERDDVMTEIAKRYALEVATETQRRCLKSVINDSSLELYGSEWNEIEELILLETNIPELI